MKFWEEFFKFLKDIFPAITAFFLGKSIGESGREDLEAKKRALSLEIERFKNVEKVNEANRGKSDDDLLSDVISDGRKKMLKPGGSEGDSDL